jgi:hypothetical protein
LCRRFYFQIRKNQIMKNFKFLLILFLLISLTIQIKAQEKNADKRRNNGMDCYQV